MLFFENVSFIGWLDTDDEYAYKDLSKIECNLMTSKPDALAAGNYLRLDGKKIIGRVNIATPKLIRHILLNRLKTNERRYC